MIRCRSHNEHHVRSCFDKRAGASWSPEFSSAPGASWKARAHMTWQGCEQTQALTARFDAAALLQYAKQS